MKGEKKPFRLEFLNGQVRTSLISAFITDFSVKFILLNLTYMLNLLNGSKKDFGVYGLYVILPAP